MWSMYVLPKGGPVVLLSSKIKPRILQDKDGRKFISLKQPLAEDETLSRMVWKKPFYLDDLINWTIPFRRGEVKAPSLQELEEGSPGKDLDPDENPIETDVLEFIVKNHLNNKACWYTYIKNAMGQDKIIRHAAYKLGAALQWLSDNGYLSTRKRGQRRYFYPTKKALEWFPED